MKNIQFFENFGKKTTMKKEKEEKINIGKDTYIFIPDEIDENDYNVFYLLESGSKELKGVMIFDKIHTKYSFKPISNTIQISLMDACVKFIRNSEEKIELKSKGDLLKKELDKKINTKLPVPEVKYIKEEEQPKPFLPKGYYIVKDDFEISPSGGWKLSFKTDNIIYSNGDGIMKKATETSIKDGDDFWKPVKPPIQYTDKLIFTSYARNPEQRSMYNRFIKYTRPISGKEAKQIIFGMLLKAGL